MSIAELRKQYHSELCAKIIRVSKNRDGIDYPNFADAASASSIAISWGVVERLGYAANKDALSGQAAGANFEQITKTFLESDRSQNARTEALNLIRNRKGRLPHISVVTAEPTPWRLASVALGTGDLDCVYHFALHELLQRFA